MYINPREYYPNDLGESIDSPKKIYRSLSAFIGGDFRLHKSGETHLPYLTFSCFHTESPAKAVIRDESGERFFTYDDDDKPRSALFFYHPDHIGSTTFVSDAQGREYEHIEYTPYGETWLNTRRGNDDDHDDDEWDWDDDEGSPIRRRFTGKEIDPETGLQYFGARYQDPRTSRWISSDPAGPELMSPMETDGQDGMKEKQDYSIVDATNWYSYSSNRPITHIDPTGLDDIALGLSFDAAAGGNEQVPGGIAANLGIVIDTDELLESGIYFSFGESAGGGASVSLGVGYYPEEIEGKSVNFSASVPLSQPLLGISGEVNIDPDSGKVSGGSLGASFGGGITVTETKTITPITVGQVISFVKKVGEYLDKRGQESPYKW